MVLARRFLGKKILIDLIGIELIALVVVVGFKLSPILLPKADVTVMPDPACDLQKQDWCIVTLPAGGRSSCRWGQGDSAGQAVPGSVTTSGFRHPGSRLTLPGSI